jgi:hypothetical protein
VSPPTLPATRDARIALAARTIAGCLGPDDQVDPAHERELGDPGVIVFRALTPSWTEGRELCEAAADALISEGLAPWTRRRMVDQGCRVEIRVPVGEP